MMQFGLIGEGMKFDEYRCFGFEVRLLSLTVVNGGETLSNSIING